MTPRSDPSAVILVRQVHHALFRALTAERAVIVFVREGKKIAWAEKREMRIGPGSLGVLPARTPLAIENRPGVGGRYVAQALAPAPSLIERMSRDGLPDGDPFVSTAHDRATAAFERAA